MFDSESLDQDDESKFAFLATNEQLNAIETDFNDPVSLMRRQKLILEAIEKHKNQNVSKFEPLTTLKKEQFLWMVLLCHGGKFVI